MDRLYRRALKENKAFRDERSRLRSEGKKKAAADPDTDIRSLLEKRKKDDKKKAEDAEADR